MRQSATKEVPRNTSHALLATSSFVPPTNVPIAEIAPRKTRRKGCEHARRFRTNSVATLRTPLPIRVQPHALGSRRVRPHPANLLHLGHQRPSIAGSQQGQVLAIHHPPPRIPEQPQAQHAFSARRTG